MTGALFHETRRNAFQHDALGNRDFAQGRQITLVHHAWVQMGQQARFFEHQQSHGAQIRQCRLVAQFGQLFPCHAIARFRLVAQGEKRFVTACLGPRAGHRQDFVRGHKGALAAPGRMGKGAVVTNIATQLGQRYEDLA